MKIQNIKDLSAVKEKHYPLIKQRLGHRNGLGLTQVMVCSGTACTSAESQVLRLKLEEELYKRGLKENVRVLKTGCFGFCPYGPIVMVHPGEIFYCLVKPEDVKELVETHLVNGQVVERLLYQNDKIGKRTPSIEDIHFFEAQKRIVLRNCGVINPEEVGEYIARDGYFALADVILHKKPGEVIDIVSKAGLRGRGGAGFPTGRKWEMTAAQGVTPKYVVCNADEGDPGAFMDRSILEGDPHSVLEAMAIAGYCTGANQGYIYVRAEYPIAVDRLEIAIEQAREIGLLGKRLFGSSFDFDIGLRFGAGAFVCGEETALLHSVMGQRGEPRPRPPYPAQEGLWGKPTLINMEEAHELLERLDGRGKLPLLSSCSPGWVKFAEHFYPEFLENLSTCKSPHEMFGALTKTYFAGKEGLDPEKIVVVAIMPCTAKKFEASRPEMGTGNFKDVDWVLTTRELARMIRQAGINFRDLPDEDYDTPMGISSGAGAIFGSTGGVIEAAVRTAYYLTSGRELDLLDYEELRGFSGLKETWVELKGRPIKVAIAHGTGNARVLMDRLKAGEQFDYVEIMACPGGCVGGGGQPIFGTREHKEISLDYRHNRADALDRIDYSKELRRAHENPAVKKIYDDFLGRPLSDLSRKLLHTYFTPRGKLPGFNFGGIKGGHAGHVEENMPPHDSQNMPVEEIAPKI